MVALLAWFVCGFSCFGCLQLSLLLTLTHVLLLSWSLVQLVLTYLFEWIAIVVIATMDACVTIITIAIAAIIACWRLSIARIAVAATV